MTKTRCGSYQFELGLNQGRPSRFSSTSTFFHQLSHRVLPYLNYGRRWFHHRRRCYFNCYILAFATDPVPTVRVRPPTTWEAGRLPEPCYDETIRGEGALSTPSKVIGTSSLRDIVQIVDDRIITFDPAEKDRAKAFVERGFMPPGSKRYKDKRFMFDRVFGHNASQFDVYQATSQPLLGGLFDGYNATVFAYGVSAASSLGNRTVFDLNNNIGYWLR